MACEKSQTQQDPSAQRFRPPQESVDRLFRYCDATGKDAGEVLAELIAQLQIPKRAAEPLTPRQQEIYRLIAEHTRRLGYPPTLRELCEATGIKSTNGITDHLAALERKGWIERIDTRARAIRLLGGTAQ